MQTHAKVVVIGGGMMGVSLLYHLAEEGWADILLLEKGELTSGSTWHAAGQCPNFIADYNMAKIHDYGVRLYPMLEEKTGQYVSWHGCGGIRLALKPQELDWFRQVEGIGKSVGFHCEIIDTEEIRRINPFVDLDGVLAGVWTANDGHVDPAGCCNALAAGARQMGATIARRTRVIDLAQRRSGEWEVITDQGTVVCEMVVNAAGCYARRIGEMVGTKVPIANMEHTYLVTDPIEEFVNRSEEMVVMRDPWPSAYYRQEQKAGLIGIYETTNAATCWRHNDGDPEWEAENELFEADLDRLSPYIERVMERMPIWREAGIRRIVCGAIPHTPDSYPLLGPAGGLRNFWHCCGASIGVAAGAGCGKYLAQWMVHGDSEINMASFDPRRFGDYSDGQYTIAKSRQDYEHMYALHLPGEERPAGRGAIKSAVHDTLVARGAVHTEVNGWERPKWFSLDGREEDLGFRHNNVFEVVAQECRAVHEGVGIFDMSSFAKYEITGGDAHAVLDVLFANRLPRPGRVVLAHALSHAGRIRGESTIVRFPEKDDFYYVVSGATSDRRDLDILSESERFAGDVHVRRVTPDWGVLVLAGPRSRDVLAQLTQSPLHNGAFGWMNAREISVGGIRLRALRVNYVGELGWELHCPMEDLADLYDLLRAAGESFGIVDFGAYAVDSLRIEKAYKGWGADLTNEIGPFEAGIERFVDFKKEHFIGKEALERNRGIGLAQRIVHLEIEPGDCDVHGGEPVFSADRSDEGRPIGITTSGAFGHCTGKSLAFAYVESERAADEMFQVEILGELRSARLLHEAVRDPHNERLRA